MDDVETTLLIDWKKTSTTRLITLSKPLCATFRKRTCWKVYERDQCIEMKRFAIEVKRRRRNTSILAVYEALIQPDINVEFYVFGADIGVVDTFLKAYRSHSTQMGQVQGALAETNTLLKSLLEAAKNPMHVLPQLQIDKTFAEVYGIVLPFEELTAFEEFDARLGADKVMCAQLKRDMWPLIEPKGDLSRSISQIIKKYMMRAVVINFTAVRKCGDKKLFKDTIFCTYVKEAIVQEFAKNPKKSPIRDKSFFDAGRTVINNAKDWEGSEYSELRKAICRSLVDQTQLIQKRKFNT